jgi:hypothetical protein
LDSPSHRKNLLNAKYKDIGVAVSTGKLNGVSTTIVVQFFAVPTSTKQQPKAVAKVTPPQPPAPGKIKRRANCSTTPAASTRCK